MIGFPAGLESIESLEELCLLVFPREDGDGVTKLAGSGRIERNSRGDRKELIEREFNFPAGHEEGKSEKAGSPLKRLFFPRE